MMRTPYSKHALRAVFLHSDALCACRNILLVEPAHEVPVALEGIEGLRVTVVEFASIDAALLAGGAPDVILAPLLSTRFDILDLARQLIALEYRGALRAYSLPLPDPELIRSEVMAECPHLDFAIFEVPAGSDRTH